MAARIRRGDVVTIVAPHDYGKPRPAVIVQTDLLNSTHASVIVCPFTTERIDAPGFRLDFSPSSETGLRLPSQLMVDKIIALPGSRIGERTGRLGKEELAAVDRSLGLVLGLADHRE